MGVFALETSVTGVPRAQPISLQPPFLQFVESAVDRTADRPPDACRCHTLMTIAWFVIWLIANTIGGNEPLTGDPANGGQRR